MKSFQSFLIYSADSWYTSDSYQNMVFFSKSLKSMYVYFYWLFNWSLLIFQNCFSFIALWESTSHVCKNGKKKWQENKKITKTWSKDKRGEWKTYWGLWSIYSYRYLKGYFFVCIGTTDEYLLFFSFLTSIAPPYWTLSLWPIESVP